jgi:hypothetical protein
LLEQSVDHITLCLSFFNRPLLGIPQPPTRIYAIFLIRLTANEKHALLTLTATVLAIILSGLHSIVPESQLRVIMGESSEQNMLSDHTYSTQSMATMG